jgi:crotonobetainyl-CoA:carnitine CoA-transferase CaiB-like acyl-CoA transferase
VETSLPLAGVRVVEVTSIYSGPLAGLLLAELGADVVKVESQSKPDLIRHTGGRPYGVTPVFYALNRGKRFVSLDASTEAGRELLADLAASADVFLHNIRPGKPESIGVGYDALAQRNPRLIYAAISGLGSEGPDADQRVYDFVVQARIGMVDYQRDPTTGRGGLMAQVVVDKATAMAAVQSILAALYVRERTGLGQRIDLSMLRIGLHFEWPDAMAPLLSQVMPSTALEQLPPHVLQMPGAGIVVLATADGGEIACSPSLPPFDGFAIAFDRPDWLVDERFADTETRIYNFPAFHAQLVEAASRFGAEVLLQRLSDNGVPAGYVRSRRDVPYDAQVKHLDLLVEHDTRSIGIVRQPRPMWQFSGTPARVTTSMGVTGQHTREVLREWGLSDARIDELIAGGVIAEGIGDLD